MAKKLFKSIQYLRTILGSIYLGIQEFHYQLQKYRRRLKKVLPLKIGALYLFEYIPST